MKQLIAGMGNVLALVLLAAAILAVVPATQARAQDEALEAGKAAVDSWLVLVDNGQYAESWAAASTYFKNALGEDDWVQALNGARSPMGAVKERVHFTAQYTASLPGAPDGQYVVVEFRTAFENKSEAVETVTAMLDNDGAWRVGGYYIK